MDQRSRLSLVPRLSALIKGGLMSTESLGTRLDPGYDYWFSGPSTHGLSRRGPTRESHFFMWLSALDYVAVW